ncbi:hypothetical protein INT45_004224, partial [Circinella minor]
MTVVQHKQQRQHSNKLLLFFIIVLLFLFLISARTAYAKEEKINYRTFEINISTGSLNPDCYDQGYSGLLVNGQFPAPPIRVTKSDHVHIVVHNHIQTNYSTAIHYHGILQLGTPEADGVPGLTQKPIQPGETYHQRFQVIEQAGTFYYHAHVGLQDDTISGPFIVYESEDAWPFLPEEESNPSIHNRRDVETKKLKDGPYEYDDERILFLSEWWHQTMDQRMNYVMGKNYRGMKGADSYLINGKAAYYPTIDSTDGSQRCEYPTIDVEPNKVYRLRVIGGLTLAVLGVSFSRHTNLTIIEVDGELVQPYSVSHLQVAPGQRFSILLSTDQPGDQSYYINTKPYYIRETEGNGRGILRYSKQLPANIASNDEKPDFPPETPQWHFANLAPLVKHVEVDLEKEADQTIIIKPTEEILDDNTTSWFMNNRLVYPHKISDQPLLELLGTNGVAKRQENSFLEEDSYDPELKAYVVGYNQTIDFVIHTTAIANGVCIGHPYHLHGMVHHVLAHGAGEYNHDNDKMLRTYPTSIARDTSFVYPVQPGPPPKVLSNTLCGWSKLRIVTV